MKNILIVFLILFTVSVFSFPANQQEMDEFMAADQIQNVNQRLEKYKELVAKYPNSAYTPAVYLNIIGIYDQKNDNANLLKYIYEADSKSMLTKAGIDDPGLASIFYGAFQKIQQTNKQEAIKLLDKIIAIANKYQGDADWDKTRTDIQAIKTRLTAPPPKPKKQDPPINAAVKDYNDKKYESALAKLAKLDQEDPKVIFYAGLSLYRTQKYSQAVNKLIRTWLLAPEEYPQAQTTAQSIYLRSIYKDSETQMTYNQLAQEIQALAKENTAVVNTWNEKFVNKTEEELTEAEKQEMAELQKLISKIERDSNYFKDKQQAALDAFNNIIEEIRKQLNEQK
ncbi:MAG: hypothetical protein KKF46_00460 [Nanoarchaeota archaeon]|nr:hypothetical protein [Nanoarchaeota archaeon]MBU1320806.1 hypothetical protein [Nanoarchaeota archaeon]MBU1596815.1 hypothetical protein [Nanoarchaeota archaeon]MBU2440884.1 hypothetical protein [Nanoarchaeota archaeon]